ncbi:MAG: protein TolQ [Deltaproteobacteria bacterium]|nr:protein TolQ [Deltaproteobacteria bacterium]
MVLTAGPVVKLVLFLLLSFSVVSWAIIFMKFQMLRKAQGETQKFLEIFWGSKSLAAAYNESKQFTHSPLAEIFRVGYLELTKIKRMWSEKEALDASALAAVPMMGGLDNIRRALRSTVTNQITKLERALPFLATTGNATPFIGLFGTVWGIMASFRGIGLRGSANLAVVAPGISEALIATAAGLAAAIPAVIAYNYYSSKVKVIETVMNNFSSDFLNIIERNELKKAGQPKIV